MKKQSFIAGAFLLAIATLLAFLWLTPSGIKPAPAIKFTTLQGQSLTLSSLQGRPVLVTFWATTCPGCIKEMPHLVELYNELGPRGFEIIGVAMAYDPEDQVRTMVAQKKIPYPISMDKNGAAARAFGDVSLTPSHFLIDPRGRIVQYKLGEMDMKVLHNRIITMLTNTKA